MTEKVANKREPVPDYKVWPCVDELLTCTLLSNKLHKACFDDFNKLSVQMPERFVQSRPRCQSFRALFSFLTYTLNNKYAFMYSVSSSINR